VDNLPIDGFFKPLSNPAGKVGKVARATIPRARILQLVEQYRVLTPGKKKKSK